MISNLNTSVDKTDAKQINILALAHLGDGVYELLVRERIISELSQKPALMHRETVKRVCAGFQSRVFDLLLTILSDDEISVMKRGRNNSTPKVPKNADCVSYRKATGVECLFGYLYIIENVDRINELFAYICEREGELLGEEGLHR